VYALEPGDDLTRTRPVVSADNRLVAAGDWSGKVIVWDLENDKITAQLSGGGEGSRIMAVTALPASPATLNNSDWFAEASSDGTVRLWDPDEQDAPQGRSAGRASRPYGRWGCPLMAPI